MTKRKKPEDKLKAGAPSKYRPEYCQRMIDYFSVGVFKARGYGKEKEYNYFPSFQAFSAKELKVTHQTLLNWCNDFPEFFEAYELCKQLQEQLLVEAGLTRAYDSGFAKFILNSVSNTFKEKIEHSLDQDSKNAIKLAYALPEKKDER